MNIELKITLWALACAYAIGNSFIYSWAFWSVFDINILQFSSFSDILPSILYTITIPCIIVAVGFVCAQVWEKFKQKAYLTIENEMSSRIKNYEAIKNIVILLSSLLMLIGSITGLVVVNKSEDTSLLTDGSGWIDLIQVGIPFILSMLVCYLIIKKTTFLNQLKLTRNLAIIIISFIPVVCYFWGHINSTRIINGKNTFLVESDTQCNSSPGTKYRYISSISDKVFAMSVTDDSICIFKYNSLKLTPEQDIGNMRALTNTSV
ncbi:hypothetical protein [Citrobacter youngae]|uniref:hypothetical protein n=1 Tax=Citrobacter youngae TaxID=133448 RepID=UPI00397CDE0C